MKKIRMVGFKSFADETVVETGSGITAIVGPNGCGKSNIVDAVRWVLGEKSGRALRGKSMDDVVFMGSESRRPAGMAEVELVFDNTTRGLPLDTDEVSIARRLFLNSPSEYFINGRRSTRRDMDRVFMDTGIGKAAYSIMEQGRMSEILKASPEERRLLFDEAAGVSRFKAEREETMGRLYDTEQNLLRLGDILKARKEEMEHLERQARKTREYLKLKEHMDRHDRNLRFLSFLDLEAKRKRTEEKLTALTLKREETFSRIKEREGKVEGLEE
ncbi:MAG: AAA family ATPase, partial [Spirochaetia bacterium]|nr:AAA family ATPase [Spirochaetia bacterium]